MCVWQILKIVPFVLFLLIFLVLLLLPNVPWICNETCGKEMENTHTPCEPNIFTSVVRRNFNGSNMRRPPISHPSQEPTKKLARIPKCFRQQPNTHPHTHTHSHTWSLVFYRKFNCVRAGRVEIRFPSVSVHSVCRFVFVNRCKNKN